MTLPREPRVTTLWNLVFNQHRVRCVVWHHDGGMELRLESATHLILSEPFDLQPRALARTRALRESLKRRGWVDENPDPGGP